MAYRHIIVQTFGNGEEVPTGQIVDSDDATCLLWLSSITRNPPMKLANSFKQPGVKCLKECFPNNILCPAMKCVMLHLTHECEL